MSEYTYAGYSEWDMQGSRRKRIGQDCIKAYESSGDEQLQKAAARIAELEEQVKRADALAEAVENHRRTGRLEQYYELSNALAAYKESKT